MVRKNMLEIGVVGVGLLFVVLTMNSTEQVGPSIGLKGHLTAPGVGHSCGTEAPVVTVGDTDPLHRTISHHFRRGVDEKWKRTIDLLNYRHPNAVCFEAGTPNDVITKFQALHFPDLNDPRAYNVLCRWPGTLGDPANITWSFAPDGVFIPSQGTGPDGNNELFSRMDALFAAQGGRATWVSLFEQSFARWAELCGTSYTRITFGGNDWDDGAAWGSGGSADRGDVRIGMRVIDGGSGILAFNPFPCSAFAGDMVMDRQENWQSSTNNFRFMRNIVMHEHGHGIGILHVCPIQQTKLMEPFLSTLFDGPQHDDIRASHDLYGDPFEANNSPAAATDLGNVGVGTDIDFPDFPPPSVSNSSILSLDQFNEEDFFRINVTEDLLLNITVASLGLVYLDDEQACGGQQANCCNTDSTDSESVTDIAIEILESDGSTLVVDIDNTPVGGDESGQVPLVAGEYFINIYADNGSNSTQLYAFSLTGKELTPCFGVECEDEFFCNGVETCDDKTGECLPGTDPCDPQTEICNEEFNQCETAPGACCLPSGDCEIISEGDCGSALGFFYGGGSTCDPPLDPPCNPVSTTVYCELSNSAAFAGESVVVQVFAEDTQQAVALGAYQTALDITNTSGSGSLSLDCTACDGSPNVPECATRIDSDRPDYVFADAAISDIPVVNCSIGAAGAFAIQGQGEISTPPVYFSEYTLDISLDATPGATFDIQPALPGDDSFLADPLSDPIAYGNGTACTLTVLDPNACLEPTVEAVGSKALVITPVGGAPVGLEVSGDANDSEVSCVSQFVQADGTLGATPVLQLPQDWGDDGTIVVRSIDLVPEKTYEVRTFCNGELSPAAMATLGVWGDVNDNMVTNLEDVQFIVLVFQGSNIVPVEAADIDPCLPNGVANIGDAQKAVLAFQGSSYVDLCGAPCP